MIAIPSKRTVSQVVGYIRGKSAIHLAQSMGNGNAFVGQYFGPGDMLKVRSVAIRPRSAFRSALKRRRRALANWLALSSHFQEPRQRPGRCFERLIDKIPDLAKRRLLAVRVTSS